MGAGRDLRHTPSGVTIGLIAVAAVSLLLIGVAFFFDLFWHARKTKTRELEDVPSASLPSAERSHLAHQGLERTPVHRELDPLHTDPDFVSFDLSWLEDQASTLDLRLLHRDTALPAWDYLVAIDLIPDDRRLARVFSYEFVDFYGSDVAQEDVLRAFQTSTPSPASRTDELGWVRLQIPPYLGLLAVIKDRADRQHSQEILWPVEPGSQNNLTLQIPPRQVVVGSVMDQAGRPMPDVMVQVELENEQLAGTDVPCCLTDSRGDFVLIGIPVGSHEIRAMPGDREGSEISDVSGATTSVEVRPEEDVTGVLLVLYRHLFIRGRVVGLASEPLLGVCVQGTGSKTGFLAQALSDRSGDFILGPLVQDDFHLDAWILPPKWIAPGMSLRYKLIDREIEYPGNPDYLEMAQRSLDLAMDGHVFSSSSGSRPGDRVLLQLLQGGCLMGHVAGYKSWDEYAVVLACLSPTLKETSDTVQRVDLSESGSFEISGLQEGVFLLLVQATESIAWREVPIGPGEQVDLGAIDLVERNRVLRVSVPNLTRECGVVISHRGVPIHSCVVTPHHRESRVALAPGLYSVVVVGVDGVQLARRDLEVRDLEESLVLAEVR